MNATTTLIEAALRDLDEISPGCRLLSQEDIIVEQQGWNDEDASKNTDFTAAPYWVTTDSGSGPYPIHTDADVDPYMEKILYGKHWYDFDAITFLFDDDLREDLHMEMAPCTKQEFFDAYIEAHEKKFDEALVIN